MNAKAILESHATTMLSWFGQSGDFSKGSETVDDITVVIRRPSQLSLGQYGFEVKGDEPMAFALASEVEVVEKKWKLVSEGKTYIIDKPPIHDDYRVLTAFSLDEVK